MLKTMPVKILQLSMQPDKGKKEMESVLHGFNCWKNCYFVPILMSTTKFGKWKPHSCGHVSTEVGRLLRDCWQFLKLTSIIETNWEWRLSCGPASIEEKKLLNYCWKIQCLIRLGRKFLKGVMTGPYERFFEMNILSGICLRKIDKKSRKCISEVDLNHHRG